MLRKVRLELARCHEHPEGSAAHGYELALPLTADLHLDRAQWLKCRTESTFRRFWGEEEPASGRLEHVRQGWILAFDRAAGESEAIFKGDSHRFAEGEYVSIRERDGQTRTFRVSFVH